MLVMGLVAIRLEDSAPWVTCDCLSLAFHEAGHAIVAARLGFRVTSVSVGPRSRTEILHSALKYNRQSELASLRKLTILALAGYAAEVRLAGGSSSDIACYHAENDLVQWREYSRQAFGKFNKPWVLKCFDRAARLLDGDWDYVRAVSKALLEKRTLSETEFFLVVSSTPCAQRLDRSRLNGANA